MRDITLDIDPMKAEAVETELLNDKGERVNFTYDPAKDEFSFDRRNSGITDFSQDFPAITTAPVYSTDSKIGVRIFIDNSSIEVFESEGRFVMTNLVFPTSPYTTMRVVSRGGNAKISNLKIYTIKN